MRDVDPRLVKGVTIVAALAVYALMGGLPPTFEAFVQQLSILLIGWQSLRRPGDLPPLQDGERL